MSTVYERPGTFTEERLLPPQPSVNPTSQAPAILQTGRRGPVEFTRVTAWNRYTKLFGQARAGDQLSLAVFNYFNNGGRVAWVCRVVGSGAEAATRTLNSASTTSALVVDAHNPGEWGDDVYVEVVEGSSPDLFSLVIYYQGTSKTNIVEQWSELSMDETSGRFVELIVNSNSTFVKVSLESGFDGPPEAAAPAVLAGGADGDAPTTSQKTDALHQLDTIDEPSVVAMPGEVDPDVASALINYADERENLFVIFDAPQGASATAVVDYAAAISTSSSYGAVYAPWVEISDPASSARGATRVTPPSGLVLGQIASVDRDRGVFKAPAGVDTRLRGAVALDQRWTDEELAQLNRSNVNALVAKPSTGPVIYGARTLRRSPAQIDRYVNVRRTMIHLKRVLSQLFEFAVFENNDEALWGRVRNAGDTFLADFWQRGGLAGETATEAYYVICDEGINTPQSVDEGYLNIEVGVAPQKPAEFVIIRINQFQGQISTSDNI